MSWKQYSVPVQGQSDIVIFGMPYVSPYNVNSILNPLLVQVMALGYLFNLNRGVPLVKKGGVIIITHPCYDEFDPDHHAPYIEFFNRLPDRDARRARAVTQVRARSSRRTPATCTCTARATATTALTPSTCGTGARTGGSTWAR